MYLLNLRNHKNLKFKIYIMVKISFAIKEKIKNSLIKFKGLEGI